MHPRFPWKPFGTIRVLPMQNLPEITYRFHSVLVLEDEPGLQQVLALILRGAGYEVMVERDGAKGLALALSQGSIDLVITDVRLPGMTGIEVLKALKAKRPEITVIVMSAYSSVELAVEAMQCGATHFISKPFKKDLLLHTLRSAEERLGLLAENRDLRAQLTKGSAPKIVGEDPKWVSLLKQLKRVARFGSTVLLRGESGTGKELLARYLHGAGEGGPFVAINCGAIPENLLESELFGHVRGAFTGADAPKEGLFVRANGGTLFLDEIGDLPLSLQVKLLRVLQENMVRPVGSLEEIPVSLRVVSATAKDLASAVTQGEFREDLYYRLNVVPVGVPPLRDRGGDIVALAQHFLEKAAVRLGTGRKHLSQGAKTALLAHTWPGNVRELQNLMERLVILTDAEEIGVEDLPFPHRAPQDLLGEVIQPGDLSIKRSVRRLEKILIVRALEKTGGRRGKAAKLLEISTRALLYKIKEYNILGED